MVASRCPYRLSPAAFTSRSISRSVRYRQALPNISWPGHRSKHQSAGLTGRSGSIPVNFGVVIGAGSPKPGGEVMGPEGSRTRQIHEGITKEMDTSWSVGKRFAYLSYAASVAVFAVCFWTMVWIVALDGSSDHCGSCEWHFDLFAAAFVVRSEMSCFENPG